MKSLLRKALTAILGGNLGLVIGAILGTAVALIVTGISTRSLLGNLNIRDAIALGICFGAVVGSLIEVHGASPEYSKRKKTKPNPVLSPYYRGGK